MKYNVQLLQYFNFKLKFNIKHNIFNIKFNI